MLGHLGSDFLDQILRLWEIVEVATRELELTIGVGGLSETTKVVGISPEMGEGGLQDVVRSVRCSTTH